MFENNVNQDKMNTETVLLMNKFVLFIFKSLQKKNNLNINCYLLYMCCTIII